MITGNSTNGPAGGIFNLPGGVLEVTGGTIANNVAATDGGGLRNLGTATLRDVALSENTAGDDGGGISNRGGRLTIGASEIRANDASDRGGGIENDGGTLTVTGGSVAGNRAGFGGGLWSSGTASLEDCAIGPANVASGGAGSGGIGNQGTIDLTDCAVTSNSASASGAGGISNRDTLTLTDSIVTNNVTNGPGGGIVAHANAVLEIRRTTIDGNTAGTDGGGIWNRGAMVMLENSTISGNATVSDGGGILDFAGASLRVLNSTISGNIAGGVGGGIGHLDGVATLKNTIVAGNTASDCAGGVISFDNNLDSDGTCNLIAPGDLTATDPLLGPLADNGGGTRTHALLEGSPAVDAGNDAGAPATDQRGRPRVGATDIGAFEFDLVIVEFTLLGGWNTLVFTGADGTDPAELVALIGPRLDSLWGYSATLQTWLVHRPGGLALLNTLGALQTGQALFLLLSAGPALPIALADLLGPGVITVSLLPEWNFVGFTGADETAVLGLLPPGVDVAFRFGVTAQAWEGVFPDSPSFLNAFTAVGRLTALFVFNGSGAILTMEWEQTPGG